MYETADHFFIMLVMVNILHASLGFSMLALYGAPRVLAKPRDHITLGLLSTKNPGATAIKDFGSVTDNVFYHRCIAALKISKRGSRHMM